MSANMSFGRALAALGVGHRVAREGWNGKGMWLVQVRGMLVEILPRLPLPTFDGKLTDETASTSIYRVEYPPHIAMKTATGEFVPWLCSVTDMMADDWCVVPV